MQYETFEHEGENVVIGVARELRNGLGVYVARVNDKPEIAAVGSDPVAAISLLRERFASEHAARATSNPRLRALKAWPQESSRPTRAYRVLVVEDDAACASIVKTLCEIEGHEVVVAANGVEALVQLGQGNFDLTITDLQMPGLDGVTLARRIRKSADKPAMPIIGVTASSETMREAMRAAGVDQVLAKPYDPLTLREAMRASLEQITLPALG